MAALPMPVLGSVGRDASIALPERHLGLVQAGEHGDLGRLFGALADLGERSLDLDAIVALAPPMDIGTGAAAGFRPPGQRVALAQDAAFSFFYAHLAEAVAACGRRDRAVLAAGG